MTKETESSKEIANIEAQIAAEANALQSVLATQVSSNHISFQGGKFTLPDQTVMPNPMKVVILGYVQTNTYYDTAWNPKKREDPKCFAVGKVGEDLKPHSSVETPICDNCEECDFNQWESDPKGGKGKACKNTFKVACIIPETGKNDIFTFNVSVTATKNWSSGVQAIIKQYGGLIKAVSHLTFDTSTGYNRVSISTAEPNPKYVEHFPLCADAMDILLKD